jgi:hypothetical protein
MLFAISYLRSFIPVLPGFPKGWRGSCSKAHSCPKNRKAGENTLLRPRSPRSPCSRLSEWRWPQSWEETLKTRTLRDHTGTFRDNTLRGKTSRLTPYQTAAPPLLFWACPQFSSNLPGVDLHRRLSDGESVRALRVARCPGLPPIHLAE